MQKRAFQACPRLPVEKDAFASVALNNTGALQGPHILEEEPTMNLIESVESQYLKSDIPEFGPGDVVKVNTRIREGQKERIQAYEGTVIRRAHSGARATFTVRRVAFGTGSERTFPLHSPNIDSIQVVRYGAVRRAKLYYLRERTGRAARVKERRR